MASLATAPAANPLEGFYAFVKQHVVVVNALVLAAGTLVATLDFLAPRVSLLPKIIYGATAGLVVLMVLAAIAPALVRRAFSFMGFAASRRDGAPLWRRPAWQLAVAILTFVSLAGYASMAKASQGGAIASAFPEIRVMQSSLLSIKADTNEIKSGVDAANSKLDALVGAVDPANPADRCPDITCAVTEGASVKAVAKLFAKGAALPPHPIHRGVLLAALGQSAKPDRAEMLDLLVAHGLDVNAIFVLSVLDPASATPAAGKLAKDALRLANYEANPVLRFTRFPPPTGDASLDAWSDLARCLASSSGGVALIELAAMRGDKELYGHLASEGVLPPSRPLVCKWRSAGNAGAARISISKGVATAAPG